jgi:hypothetical protein
MPHMPTIEVWTFMRKVLLVLIGHVCTEKCGKAEKKSDSRSGSSMVNSPAYIANWQRIFGGQAKEAKA